jgi:hypothetical protein
MTPEAQRIAIAEACGWRFEKKPRVGMLSKLPCWHITSPEGVTRTHHQRIFQTINGLDSVSVMWEDSLEDGLRECSVPDYLNDLNAMREAEKEGLTDTQWDKFCHTLFDIVHPWDDCCSFEWIVSAICQSTPSQHAEAFLKTLNLWK